MRRTHLQELLVTAAVIMRCCQGFQLNWLVAPAMNTCTPACSIKQERDLLLTMLRNRRCIRAAAER